MKRARLVDAYGTELCQMLGKLMDKEDRRGPCIISIQPLQGKDMDPLGNRLSEFIGGLSDDFR